MLFSIRALEDDWFDVYNITSCIVPSNAVPVTNPESDPKYNPENDELPGFPTTTLLPSTDISLADPLNNPYIKS
jgi:hypothetical protein